GARPPSEVLNDFVDQHRQAYGVESICKVLQIAPSGYWRHAAHQRNPQLRCPRAQRDDTLVPHVERVWQANMRVYGADKVWKQMNREGVVIARCTVERLMKRLGLQGVRRGKVVRTTLSDMKAPCPLDRVNRQFKAERPNQLWVSDFTYVSTWQGWLYVAFVIDVYARRIVGWRVSTSMHTDFVLDALEQALYARQPERDGALIHHSDRGSQYVSIRYSERLSEAGIEPSVGSKGDSYDNALAETINGLYKAEVIHRRSWPTRESVELATLEWVSWFNHHRLLGPIGYIPPAEAEANYYRQLASQSSMVVA
ncbi:MAG: IS3 family transposase, partial [Hydrogenophaga sp.]|nr:IS3 family transposase [Hydrogenophaga sp.]